MTDYKVTIKVQNNNILKRITDSGYKTVGEFCAINPSLKTKKTLLYEIISMKSTPLNPRGEFKSCILEAANILNCSPEDFFTDTQLTTAIETNKHTIEVNEAEMKFMLTNQQEKKSLEQLVYDDEMHKMMTTMLETLTPKEAKVITERFGLHGNEPKTLEEVARHFDVTRERIHQTEVKALRKLRHPSHSSEIREYLKETI